MDFGWLFGGEKEPHEKVNRRVKTPTVLQMEAVECGAAALGSVLGYYGRTVPLERLRIDCGVSRDGSKASNMLKAARKYDLECHGYKKQPEDLLELDFPVILFWNFNHFVVLEGIKNGEVYLNDPASGPKTVSWEKLKKSFTGVVLTFEPTEDFEEGGERHSVFGALVDRLAGVKTGLLMTVLAGLLLVIPGLITPIFSRIFVDYYLVENLESWLKPLLAFMFFTGLVQAALTWLQKHYLLRMNTKVALSESGRFLWHVLRLPVDFFEQRYAGDISSRVGINDKISGIVTGQFTSNIISLVMVVFYGALMFYYDVVLTLIVILASAIDIIALRYVSRLREDANRRLQKDQGKLQGEVMSGLKSIETLKSSGGEDDFFSTCSGRFASVVNQSQHLSIMTKKLNVVPGLLKSLAMAFILGIGGLRVMEGELTMGMLVAFQSLSGSFLAPVKQLVNFGAQLQEARGDLERLEDVLRYDRDPVFENDTRTEGEEELNLSGRLEVNNLKFGYNPLDEPLIEDFSLDLEPGMRVALVGASGCGKSTLAKLITGLLQPWSGEILFDGRPREEHPRQSLNESLSFVDQEINLFAGTIRENLTLWDDTVPDRRIIRATKDARIHDVIAARPEGYDSSLDEDGKNFSGGQRQRLEIARALVCNPNLLVLDEATSALDPTTEAEIDDNIRRRGCTCVIVAHRLSTIRDCDEIIVLDKGNIVERGTHEQLYEEGGHYAELLQSDLEVSGTEEEQQ